MYLLVTVSTSIIFVLSVILAFLLSVNYVRKKMLSYLLWSVGLWLFAISVGLEITFSIGLFNELMIKTYTLMVALLVGSLALGSVSLMRRRMLLLAISLYFVASALFLTTSLAVTNISNIIVNGVVFGALPFLVVLSSSLVTFPAAVILVVVSIISYRKSKNWKLFSIIAGVIIVSIAGTLYIASFPAFLYIAEFIGILLLWIGFIDFRYLLVPKEVRESNVDSNL